MAVAVNKTLAHHLPKLLFFFGATEHPFRGNNKQPAGMNIVVHSEEEKVKENGLYLFYSNFFS
jgi:hypothetical protein